MADLISEYGYLAVLIGCMMEGETVLVLGAIAAKLGYLDIGLVILAATAGTFVGDNLFFFLGRWYGDKLIRRWPSWRKRAFGVKRLLKNYDIWFIFGFRFIYGIRSICPFVIGMSGVRPRRFMLLNLLATTTWASAIGGASFALGSAMELFLARLKGFEAVVIAAAVTAALALWALYLVRIKMRTRVLFDENGDPMEPADQRRLRRRRKRAQTNSD